MNIGDLESKWSSFGWEVISLDGHDINAIINAISKKVSSKPKVIIANTIKGKGISFMENNNTWHHNRLTQSTYDQAISELTNI
jgi:transketolase